MTLLTHGVWGAAYPLVQAITVLTQTAPTEEAFLRTVAGFQPSSCRVRETHAPPERPSYQPPSSTTCSRQAPSYRSHSHQRNPPLRLLLNHPHYLYCCPANRVKTNNINSYITLTTNNTILKGRKALEAFHSGREYHHVKYVKNRKRQRNYLILLKKDPVMEIRLL